MVKIFALIAVAIIGCVLLFASSKPDTFQVERSIRIKASPEDVFVLINDFHNWDGWSPWTQKDPAMKIVHSGARSGMGTVYEWAGNRDVGSGRMEIIDMSPPSKIIIQLDIAEPFAAHNMVEFSLEPIDDHVETTWRTHGPMSFIAKLFSLFLSMDSMIGPDFETGLANLKELAEN